MAINLNKEKISESKEPVVFSDENFENINLDNLKENKRIFIPYDELPDSEEMRYSYLESLISFIERKTEKHCSYFLVHETEPYEVSGFYIQSAPELKDRNGIYVSNNDFVYDKNGVKWHVIYYYKNNQPCILIDNDSSGYAVVSSLSEFSLNPDNEIVRVSEKDSEECMKIEIKTEETHVFSIGTVSVGVLFGILVVMAVVFLFTQLWNVSDGISEMLSNAVKESAQTQNDSETSLIDTFTTVREEVMSIAKKMFLIFIPIIPINCAIKMIKR